MSISSKQVQARDLKQRVLTCLHKLSDRDTHTAAASELESISKILTPDALPSFLSSISATDSSDKSPVRRQCVRLISVLSDHHGNSLSPHLSKLLNAVLRRLRDPDSAVRAACVAASLSLSSHLTSVPFTSIAKPFLEALFIEQDLNTQNGVALCLAAIIEGSTNPDAGSLRRLLPRLEKLAKSESFKAKSALLVLIRTTMEVNGVFNGCGKNTIKDLIMCLITFLSSDDWSARKASAEALIKITVVERDTLSEYKASCLKTFEAKRFDKVKAARETMNQMIEAWKDIPDQVEASPPHESQGSSKEIASDGRYPQVKKSRPNKTPYPDSTPPSMARAKMSLNGNENKTGAAMFRKLDRKKTVNSKVGISQPTCSSATVVSEDNGEEIVLETREDEIKQFTKPEIRRALFNDKQKPILFKSGSRVGPCGESSVVVSNETGDICRNQNQRDCEDLSLIRKQLVQIETQQSNLLDVLQRYIGSSQSDIHSLEARVHGLELAIDNISFDISLSTGRMSQSNGTCCKLPGSDFLSSKLWRKTEARLSTSRLPTSCGTTSVSAVNGISDKNGDGQGFPLQNRRYQLQGGRGLIMNPLAEIPRSPQGV